MFLLSSDIWEWFLDIIAPPQKVIAVPYLEHWM
ncbi:hypothetical protein CFREI_04020 [Corynebacterium freiburgense]|nr:hypothetical protein CFREI_04020 [Corynebacterium freiburgense]